MSERSVTGNGHGKAIVVGEHFVMDGAAALVVGLGHLRTDVTMRRLGPDREALSVKWQGQALAPEIEADTLKMLSRACTLAGAKGAIGVDVTSSVPIRRGLGSSAALAVAALRAAYALMRRSQPDSSDLLGMARDIEGVVHGVSSGLDPAAACSTDAVLFQGGAVFRRVVPQGEQLEAARWVLLDLGEGAPTRDAIAAAVARRAAMGSKDLRLLTDTTTLAAMEAADALDLGDVERLARAMQRAAGALVPLGVVNQRMTDVMDAALAGGAMAVKQTGAGLGGTLLALCRTDEAARQLTQQLATQIAGSWVLPIAAKERN